MPQEHVVWGGNGERASRCRVTPPLTLLYGCYVCIILFENNKDSGPSLHINIPLAQQRYLCDNGEHALELLVGEGYKKLRSTKVRVRHVRQGWLKTLLLRRVPTHPKILRRRGGTHLLACTPVSLQTTCLWHTVQPPPNPDESSLRNTNYVTSRIEPYHFWATFYESTFGLLYCTRKKNASPSAVLLQ